MKILGIDPGMAIVGYGLVEFNNDEVALLSSGSIQTSKGLSDEKRLWDIFGDVCTLMETLKPDCVSIEKLFFFKNQKTIIPVAEARGVILAAVTKYGIPIYEYTPMEVKQILTGYGRASKKEVEDMVQLSLNGITLPKLDDTIDAIAIAITHSRSIR